MASFAAPPSRDYSWVAENGNVRGPLRGGVRGAGCILIACNGHVRNDGGVPWSLARLEPEAHTLGIGLLEVHDDLHRLPRDLPYECVWFTPRVDDGVDACAAHEIELQRLPMPSRRRQRLQERTFYDRSAARISFAMSGAMGDAKRIELIGSWPGDEASEQHARGAVFHARGSIARSSCATCAGSPSVSALPQTAVHAPPDARQARAARTDIGAAQQMV